MHVERHDISITTNADGAATCYSPVITGRIVNVIYTKPGTSPLDAGADFTITLEATGQAVLSLTDAGGASFVKAPRQATHDVAGAASLYASAGEPVEDFIYAAKDRVKVVVAQGGNTLSGSIAVVVA